MREIPNSLFKVLAVEEMSLRKMKIGRAIEKVVEKSLEYAYRTKPIPNIIFVHELIYCPQRSIYANDPQYKHILIENAENPVYLTGHIVEKGVSQYMIEAVPEVIRSYVVEKEIIGYKIMGEIDILYDHTPIEVKFSSRGVNAPYEHHLIQVKLYMWLLNSNRGELIYISPFGIKAFEITEALDDNDVMSLITRFKTEIKPVWDWECTKYCPFYNICTNPYKKPKPI
uniref:CRISPR-associated exonuclease Cas4 n=1 Tax=Caldicellulosiruptor owensensis TaxID=55205 RepID=A0A7C5V1E0_9FIRM